MSLFSAVVFDFVYSYQSLGRLDFCTSQVIVHTMENMHSNYYMAAVNDIYEWALSVGHFCDTIVLGLSQAHVRKQSKQNVVKGCTLFSVRKLPCMGSRVARIAPTPFPGQRL